MNSIITTISIQRAGDIIATRQAVQIEIAQPRALADGAGESMYDLFNLISLGGTIDIQRQDLLIDENYIDPVTGANIQYRVFGPVEHFTLMAHTEAEIQQISGRGGA